MLILRLYMSSDELPSDIIESSRSEERFKTQNNEIIRPQSTHRIRHTHLIQRHPNYNAPNTTTAVASAAAAPVRQLTFCMEIVAGTLHG